MVEDALALHYFDLCTGRNRLSTDVEALHWR